MTAITTIQRQVLARLLRREPQTARQLGVRIGTLKALRRHRCVVPEPNTQDTGVVWYITDKGRREAAE